MTSGSSKLPASPNCQMPVSLLSKCASATTARALTELFSSADLTAKMPILRRASSMPTEVRLEVRVTERAAPRLVFITLPYGGELRSELPLPPESSTDDWCHARAHGSNSNLIWGGPPSRAQQIGRASCRE